MITIDPKSLIDRLTPRARDALEQGAGLCLSRTHYSVEIEHWLLKLIEQEQGDLLQLIRQLNLDPAQITAQLNRSLERMRSGNARPPTLAHSTLELIQNAWLIASLELQAGQISSGHLFAALLGNSGSRRLILDSCPLFSDLVPEVVHQLVQDWQPHSTELQIGGASTQAPHSSTSDTTPGVTPTLDKYTTNLTERAAAGELDPVLGRDQEIRQCIDVLTRRRQNNPILTGEAGVGKTAVVEGLAQRIQSGDVPEPLKRVSLRVLDLGLLQAGASLKGEFENRLKQMIDEVKSSPEPIILFIDEAHTLIGAGGAEGQGDAANLLKPALARGELRTIAATTWAEYKKYFERDPALTRRFQVVQVEEPSIENAVTMMRGIAPKFQQHHGVRILDEAVVASVQLSSRYISGRQLPDKSVSLLDTACARVGLSLSTTPAPIEDVERRLQQAEFTKATLTREDATDGGRSQAIADLEAQIQEDTAKLKKLHSQWVRERALVEEIQALRAQLDTDQVEPDVSEAALITADENIVPDLDAVAPPTVEQDQVASQELRQRLAGLAEELQQVQGQHPLIHTQVDAQAIATVVANWTGIPVGKMIADEIASVLRLEDELQQRVVGQPQALHAIAQAVRTARAGLMDPRKPLGVFLMVGPSGVGKTETALALADLLFGGQQNLTLINMAEFKEEHKVSMLLGSPPGYVGYGEGGVLTEAARRKPYSVILLDEMEKAHPGVQDIFYNLFDKGTIKDGEGRDIDFKNTLIIMTSNAAEEPIRVLCQDQAQRPEPRDLLEQIRPSLLRHFKPAFLGRTTLVPYYPLDSESLTRIAAITVSRVEKRVRAHYGADFEVDPAVLEYLVSRCQDADTGARNLENIVNRSILPELASRCLERMATGASVDRIRIELSDKGVLDYLVDSAS